MKKINVVLVGLGFGGCFVPIYLDHPNVEVTGICDTNLELLEILNCWKNSKNSILL